ncbi:hypothetical protein ACVMIH_005195 [Bradyrhizobium sp. USDA 4503]
MTKFHGTLDELKAAVDVCGLVGEWRNNDKGGNHSFRGRTGEILNWWPAKGTIQFQGHNQDGFRAAFSGVVAGATTTTPVSAAANAKILWSMATTATPVTSLNSF